MPSSDKLIYTIVDDVNRYSRDKYERILVELGLYDFQQLHDVEEGYAKILSKKEFIQITLEEKGVEVLIDALNEKGMLSHKTIKLLHEDGYEIFDKQETSSTAKGHISETASQKETSIQPKTRSKTGAISNNPFEKNKIKKRAIPTAVVVALIGLAGTIIAAMIAIFGTLTSIKYPIAVTQTAEAKLFQSTIDTTIISSINITPNPTDIASSIIYTPIPGRNLISNASFEFDPQAENPKWNLIKKKSDVIGEWSTQMSGWGSHSLSLSTSRLNSPSTSEDNWTLDAPGWYTSDPIFVKYGFKYAFTVLSYTGNGGSSLLSIEFFNQQGEAVYGIESGCETPPAKNRWATQEIMIDTTEMETDRKATISFVQLGLAQCLKYTEGTNTTIYFDDVFFGVY